MALLDVSELSVRYGGVGAVDAVDLSVEQGSIVGLIGPNGAGKTSLIDALTGFTPSTGKIEFCGHSFGHLNAHARSRAGLARTFQSGELFEDLTIFDNVLVAAEAIGSTRSLLVDLVRPTRTAPVEVHTALEVLDLGGLADRLPAEISYGQRKLVGVARALASRPRLLLLDEPAAGLDTAESKHFGETLKQIASTNMSVLLVDHDMSLVMNTSDMVYVLDYGRVIAAGPPNAVRNDPVVIAAYLGVDQIPGNGSPAKGGQA